MGKVLLGVIYQKVECPASTFGACSICRAMLLLQNGQECPVELTADFIKISVDSALEILTSCPKALPTQQQEKYIRSLSEVLG